MRLSSSSSQSQPYILCIIFHIYCAYIRYCLRKTTVASRPPECVLCACMTGDTRDIELLLFNDDDFRKRKIVLNSYGGGTTATAAPVYI